VVNLYGIRILPLGTPEKSLPDNIHLISLCSDDGVMGSLSDRGSVSNFLLHLNWSISANNIGPSRFPSLSSEPILTGNVHLVCTLLRWEKSRIQDNTGYKREWVQEKRCIGCPFYCHLWSLVLSSWRRQALNVSMPGNGEECEYSSAGLV
jgi:hypothetical protein